MKKTAAANLDRIFTASSRNEELQTQYFRLRRCVRSLFSFSGALRHAKTILFEYVPIIYMWRLFIRPKTVSDIVDD